jgi:hypothetical protein
VTLRDSIKKEKSKIFICVYVYNNYIKKETRSFFFILLEVVDQSLGGRRDSFHKIKIDNNKERKG